MANVKTSEDLRADYNAVSKLCRESRKPVFITDNGKEDLVVMSREVYKE